MATSVKELIESANVLVVDVRDTPEVERSGKIGGALHVSRGMPDRLKDNA